MYVYTIDVNDYDYELTISCKICSDPDIKYCVVFIFNK